MDDTTKKFLEEKFSGIDDKFSQLDQKMANKDDLKQLSMDIGDHLDYRFDDLEKTLTNHNAELKDQHKRIEKLENTVPRTHNQ
jgi:hypothetical protein